jgi:hypothetical protein
MTHHKLAPWALAVSWVMILGACAPTATEEKNGQGAEESTVSPDQQAALDRLQESSAKGDGYGLIFFDSIYLNLAVAAESDQGDIALVAGSHSQDFPYYGTEPWDNGLLLVGKEGYYFTHRRQGEHLTIDVNTQERGSQGRIAYHGLMVRASDKAEVQVDLELPIDYVAQSVRQLGKPYNFLDIKRIPGMRWQPYFLRGFEGSVRVDGGEAIAIRQLRGEVEEGITANLQAPEFAFSYDYICVAQAGQNGYAFVDFVSHSLYPEEPIGELIEPIVVLTASASLTLQGGEELDGNARSVRRPPQSDASVVLFETSVDLGLSTLRRQMIKTSDAEGKALYGLREIFEVNPR